MTTSNKKFILVNFPGFKGTEMPKFLKTFSDRKGQIDPVKSIAGITLANTNIQYSEGLENVLIFSKENEAGLAQQALNRSRHGSSWCVRELTETTTPKELLKGYLKANIHIERYKKALSEIED